MSSFLNHGHHLLYARYAAVQVVFVSGNLQRNVANTEDPSLSPQYY